MVNQLFRLGHFNSELLVYWRVTIQFTINHLAVHHPNRMVSINILLVKKLGAMRDHRSLGSLMMFNGQIIYKGGDANYQVGLVSVI